MDLIQITVRDGQEPTKEQMQEVQAAHKLPPVHDVDCPPSNPEALAEFAAKARELRRTMQRTKPAVTIRLSQDYINRYKALGKGYTGIMADVLAYAADHPEILSQVTTDSSSD
jgi:uncharacterized protein (DUF4415 family)